VCAATVGFNVECVEYRKMIFSLWDLGGSLDARAFWRFYYEDTQAIIFVVDSSDLERMVRRDIACPPPRLYRTHHGPPPPYRRIADLL
jgi:GTPase SAR1 family protein